MVSTIVRLMEQFTGDSRRVKAGVLEFDPLDPPDVYTCHTTASVEQLLPRAEALVAHLKAGVLRLSATGGLRLVREGED
jgi:hypothetical protein